MTQYINKDALVAEIEKIIEEPAPSHDSQCSWEDGYYCGLCKAESIIDIIKVKEVDLEEEIDNYFNTSVRKNIQANDNVTLFMQCRKVARHFFELGIKAQKED